MKKTAFLGGTVFGCVLGLGLLARASLGGPTGVTIPYQGHLERDGTPVSGVVKMAFDVFNSQGAAAACFTSPATDINVFQGEFATTFKVTPETCVTGQEVWIGTRVNAGTATEIVLGGRQRIYPYVAALTSGQGDFSVAGTLSAAAVNVTGAVNAGSAAVTGNVTAAKIGIGGVAAGAGNAPLTFNNVLGNKLVLWDNGGNQQFGFGINGANLTAFVPSGSRFSVRQGYYNGAEVFSVDENGKALRTEYQTSCTAGSAGNHFPFCCRVSVRDGSTACRVTNGSTYGAWGDINVPFGSGSDGPYSISCAAWISGTSYPLCCRTGASGQVLCSYNANANLNGGWTSSAALY